MIAALRAELRALLERPSDVRFYVEDAWEWFHGQTFERVGLTLTTTKQYTQMGRTAFNYGRETERTKYEPEPPPVRRLHAVR